MRRNLIFNVTRWIKWPLQNAKHFPKKACAQRSAKKKGYIRHFHRYFGNSISTDLSEKTLAQRNATQRIMSDASDPITNDDNAPENPMNEPEPKSTPLSKNAQKKLLKQQRFEAKKAERKALLKEKKQKEAERKRFEWQSKLESVSEEEKSKLIESRKEMRKERMEKRSEDREKKIERMKRAIEVGQKIVVDLEFSDLMNPNEIHSLVQQVGFSFLYF